MTHGHEVLAMMQGHSYSEKSLLEAIIAKFGTEERFYTCSAEKLTAQELIDFLRNTASSSRWTTASRWTPPKCARMNNKTKR